MKDLLLNISVRFKLFLPIVVAIVVSICIVTYFSIDKSIKSINKSIEENLSLQVKTIEKMFERERALKLEKVKIGLKVAHNLFYSNTLSISDEIIEIEAVDQITKKSQKVEVKKWFVEDKNLHSNYDFVDKMQSLFGGTVTIFQKIDDGYLRISTNVLKLDNSRAVGTFIPNESEVIKAIEKGETYYGRAYVVNDWYITAYEPIYYNGKIVGVLYVGDKEKDLDGLRAVLKDLEIGKSGYPFVFDEYANILMHPEAEGENWKTDSIIQHIIQNKSGVTKYVTEKRQKYIVAFDYYKDFKVYIVATILPKEETEGLIKKIIVNSSVIAFIIMFLLIAFVYFVTSENIHNYLKQIEDTDEKLQKTRDALEQSEKLADMGKLSAGIAHEVNNPLGVILMHAHILKEEVDKDSSIYSDLSLIADQADRCKNILSGLLNFARSNKVVLKETNVIDMFNMLEDEIIIPEKVSLNVIHNLDNNIAYLDTGQILQVLKNIVNNSIDAMNRFGDIIINTYNKNDELIITISDDGPGIAQDNIEKLFEPFYTTKRSGRGTGLGLAVAYGVIKMHKGQIEVESNDDTKKGLIGTKFIISLPTNS